MLVPSRLRNLLVSGLAFLAVAVLLAPSAAAQVSTTFTVGTITLDTNDPIQVDTGKATVSVPWVYTIPTQGGFAVGGVTKSTTLQWEAPSCEEKGVIITGALTETIIIQTGTTAPKDSVSGTSTFNLLVNQQAPGELAITCTVAGKVNALQGSQVPETDRSSGTFTVTAKFLGLLSASVASTIEQAGPQKQISYDISLTNLGNANTNVVFDIPGEVSGGWKPVAPTPLVLGSTAQGATNTEKTVSFLISTPFKNGWNNDEDLFQLSITPTSTKDPELKGTQIVVNVLARVRGVYVPSLEPTLMLGALLASAFVVRLASRKD